MQLKVKKKEAYLVEAVKARGVIIKHRLDK